MILLDTNIIHQQLAINNFKKPTEFHLFTSIDSTNRWLKELPPGNAIAICCAEMQTAGRGRFGRHWHSPFGENIYCSIRWHFDCELSRLANLSLVVSLAILATLKQVGVSSEHIRVKWPNDILWYHKKLCGSLIEVVAEHKNGVDVIIGIGLNVNSITDEQPLPDKLWCSLLDITGNYTDRNLVIAQLIIQIDHFFNEFMLQGFAGFIKKWHSMDYLQDQMITVSNPTGLLSGRSQGVNEIGQLVLVDEAGVTHYLSSGDTSLHSEFRQKI